MNEPLAFSVRTPFAGWLTALAVNGLPSASRSLPKTAGAATVRGVSSIAVYVSLTATGASFTFVTVSVTVARSQAADPSRD